MIVSTEPCGQCLCCKAGRRCARVLYLDAKDAALVAKVNGIIGEPSGRTIHIRPAGTTKGRKPDPPEPMVTARCSRCDEDYELLAYVAHTLKLRGHAPPPCEGCRYGNERADLR